MDFEQWMRKVDAEIAERLLGLTSSDLPDKCYRDMYETDMTPEEAAAEVLEEEGYTE